MLPRVGGDERGGVMDARGRRIDRLGERLRADEDNEARRARSAIVHTGQ